MCKQKQIKKQKKKWQKKKGIPKKNRCLYNRYIQGQHAHTYQYDMLWTGNSIYI